MIIGRKEGRIVSVGRKEELGQPNMEDSDIIVSGAELSGPEFWGSLAEYLIPKMKAQPKDFIAQVDRATNESITTHDFLQQSLEITEGLIEFGLKADDVVIFASSTNKIRSQVAAMGIFLSGGIFTPIDETLKTLELQLFFKEFKPKFVICEMENAKEMQSCVRAVGVSVKIILMDSKDRIGEFFTWEDIKTKVDVESYVPRPVLDPKNCVCTLICSSGSTGMPKGVALSHYAVLANISLTESMAIPEAHQNFLLTSPLFWISGTMLLLNSSYYGQTRYVPKSTEPEDMLEGIEKCQPLFLMVAPSTLLSLVTYENFKKYNTDSVKNIFSLGGALSPTVKNKVKEVWENVKVSNFYGLTEVSGGITVAIDHDNPSAIGKLLPGVKVKVVDVATGKCLGPNKTGEIRIKTNRMMNCYYNNEEATRASFDEGGWLRTGDLVYYDENFVFYFVNRIKEIIHYLNYKISPLEIEAFIISLPGVKDVAVVGVPHSTDTNHLRALVVKHPNSDITAEEIIQQVKENFTDRKHLKEGVQFVDALPRTTVGKLRRVEAQKLIQVGK